jgi:hypothetical protein
MFDTRRGTRRGVKAPARAALWSAAPINGAAHVVSDANAG